MAFTQADLDRIERAIATGEMTVEVDGKRVTYRSISDLIKAKEKIENKLNGTSGDKVSFASFSKE